MGGVQLQGRRSAVAVRWQTSMQNVLMAVAAGFFFSMVGSGLTVYLGAFWERGLSSEAEVCVLAGL